MATQLIVRGVAIGCCRTSGLLRRAWRLGCYFGCVIVNRGNNSVAQPNARLRLPESFVFVIIYTFGKCNLQLWFESEGDLIPFTIAQRLCIIPIDPLNKRSALHCGVSIYCPLVCFWGFPMSHDVFISAWHKFITL